MIVVPMRTKAVEGEAEGIRMLANEQQLEARAAEAGAGGVTRAHLSSSCSQAEPVKKTDGQLRAEKKPAG